MFRRAVTVSACLLLAAASLRSQQPPAPALAPPSPDGLLRSELSMLGRTASIAVTPALRASDPANQSAFSGEGRIRIGELRTNGVLKSGAASVGKPGLAAVRYELWLDSTRDGWQLEAIEIIPPKDAPAAATSAAVKIPVTRTRSQAASPTLTAVLLPSTRETGRLQMNWGDFSADAPLQFTEFQLPRPTETRPNQPVNRRHDEGNPGARLLLLSQLNETALVLPKGSRVSVTFPRTFQKGQRSVSAAGTVTREGLTVEGRDFAHLMTTADRAVVELSEAPVPKLVTDVPIRFGNVLLKPGNQAPGYPGAYGLWVKRVGRGWRLVFSAEPDTWGSQHDAQFDLGDTELTYTRRGDATRPFAVAIEPTTADRGRLLIQWGPHEWTANYVIG